MPPMAAPPRVSKQEAAESGSRVSWLSRASSAFQNVSGRASAKMFPSSTAAPTDLQTLDASNLSPRTYRRICNSLSSLKKSACSFGTSFGELTKSGKKSRPIRSKHYEVLVPTISERVTIPAEDEALQQVTPDTERGGRGEEILAQRRAIKGRTGQKSVKSDSELYGDARARAVLEVLRSSLSAEEKLQEIKRKHDHWEGLTVFQPACPDASQPDLGLAAAETGRPNMSEDCPVLSTTDQSSVSLIAVRDSSPEEESVVPSSVSSRNALSMLHIPPPEMTNSNGASNSQPPRSPVTVQEWVNSIDLISEVERLEEGSQQTREQEAAVVTNEGGLSTQDVSTHLEDNLHLGAEARNLAGVSKDSDKKRKNVLTLAEFRSKQSSFNSETSTFSTVSSLSSVESLLEARKEDPEEILLALGFGAPKQEPMARIPRRFLSQPSGARGVDLEAFVSRQEDDLQRQECSFHGYLGLSAKSPGDNRQPSAIANKIIETLGAGQMGRQHKLSTGSLGSPGSYSRMPGAVAAAIVAAGAFKSGVGKSRRSSDSILDPANREFLLRQGKEEENGHLSRPKVLVIGKQKFSLDQDGIGLIPSNQHQQQSKNSHWESVFRRMESVSEEVGGSHDRRNDEPFAERETKTRPLLIRQPKISCANEEVGSSSVWQSQSSSLIDEREAITKKDSFELEEMSFGEWTDAETPNSQSIRSICGAGSSFQSDSSGFAEEGHQLVVPPGTIHAEVEDACIGVVSMEIEENSLEDREEEVSLPLCRTGLDTLLPASALSRHSSTTTITESNQRGASFLRKSSYPQLTPRKWNVATSRWPVVPRHLIWSLSAEGLNAVCDLPEALFSKSSSRNCSSGDEDVPPNDEQQFKDFACQTDEDDSSNVFLEKHVQQPNSAGHIISQESLLELQSLRLALEHYKARVGLQFMDFSDKRFASDLSQDDRLRMEGLGELRTNIGQEIEEMERLIALHVSHARSTTALSFRFPQAIQQMTWLIREQSTLCGQMERLLDGCPLAQRLSHVTVDLGRELETLKREFLSDQEKLITNAKEEILLEMKKILAGKNKD